MLIAPSLCLAFLAILFLQSGLDKVFNYKGNYEWLKDHFEKSPLKNSVRMLLPAITLLEVASGACCGVGLMMLILLGDVQVALTGAFLSSLSITSLFFGQRIAQDYAGAATLTSYFIVTILTIYLLYPG